jgi:hypothetical protein
MAEHWAGVACSVSDVLMGDGCACAPSSSWWNSNSGCNPPLQFQTWRALSHTTYQPLCNMQTGSNNMTKQTSKSISFKLLHANQHLYTQLPVAHGMQINTSSVQFFLDHKQIISVFCYDESLNKFRDVIQPKLPQQHINTYLLFPLSKTNDSVLSRYECI